MLLELGILVYERGLYFFRGDHTVPDMNFHVLLGYVANFKDEKSRFLQLHGSYNIYIVHLS